MEGGEGFSQGLGDCYSSTYKEASVRFLNGQMRVI